MAESINDSLGDTSTALKTALPSVHLIKTSLKSPSPNSLFVFLAAENAKEAIAAAIFLSNPVDSADAITKPSIEETTQAFREPSFVILSRSF